MCYGVCACGEPKFVNGICPNCGSMAPLSGQTVWHAPEHPQYAHNWAAGRRSVGGNRGPS